MGMGPGKAWTCLVAPFSVEKAWGTRARVAIKGTVNGFNYRTSLFPMGGGEPGWDEPSAGSLSDLVGGLTFVGRSVSSGLDVVFLKIRESNVATGVPLFLGMVPAYAEHTEPVIAHLLLKLRSLRELMARSCLFQSV